MPITPIPNQPIVFNVNDDNCNCPILHNAAVHYDRTDAIPLLLHLSPCPGERNILKNGSFEDDSEWVLTGNVNISAGKLNKTAGAAGDATQQNVFLNDTIYQIEVLVDEISSGKIRILTDMVVAKEVTAAGQYKFLVNGSFNDLTISFLDDNTVASVSDVKVFRIINNHYIFSALNDTVVFGNNFVNLFTCLDNQYIQLEFQLSEEGCQNLYIIDGCALSCDLSFDDPTFTFAYEYELDKSPNHAFTFDNGILVDATNLGTSVICIGMKLCKDVQYNINIELIEMLKIEVNILANGTPIYTFAADFIGSLSYTPTDDEDICIEFTSLLEGGTANFVSMFIEAVNPYNIELAKYKSQIIKIANIKNDCSFKKVTLCNENYGNGFIPCFKPFARYISNLINPKPINNERVVNDLNNGTKRLQYSERLKEWEFRTDVLDMYQLDFLSLIPYTMHVYIDGVEYFANEDDVALNYSIDAPNFSALSVRLIEQKALINVNDGTNQCISDAGVGIKSPFFDLLSDGSTGGDLDIDVLGGMTRN